MAIAGFARKAYHGGGHAGTAAARVRYITRTGEYSQAEARIRHQGLQHGTELDREDLVYWRARNLPDWAHDAAHFFTEAEARESAKNVAYEEWKVSLPRELSRREQMDAARDFITTGFGTQHPVCWAFHDPPAADQGRQPHLHIISSARTLDGIERSPEQFFRRYNRAHPEKGGAEKARAFSHFGAVKAFRQLYCDTMNLYLEQAGHAARLHPDSLGMRGLTRAPEPKLLPSDSNAYKRGLVTKDMQAVLDHRHARRQHDAAEQSQAQEHWQARKQELGLAEGLAHEAKLERLGQAREQAVHQVPEGTDARALAREAQGLERSIQGLETYVDQVRVERTSEEAYERGGGLRSVQAQWRSERILAEGVKHGLPRDHEAEAVSQIAMQFERLARRRQEQEVGGPGWRLRLHPEQDRDQGRDRGMGF